MATDFGIDLGTQRTVIYSGKSIVLDELTAVSYETRTGELIAAGDDAYNMLGRTPASVTAVCPIKNGVIAEYDVAESMLSAFLNQVANNKMFKARVMVAVPSSITEMQKRSIYNACSSSGARDVCLIEGPVAAAIGIGLDFTTPKGSIIVDVGAGTTDIATLSMGGLVKYQSTNVAGSSFNNAIAKYIKREHSVIIGPHTAEQIKRQIGCVTQRPLELTITAKGQHQFTGMPQTFEINTNEMITALYDTAVSICKSVQSVIEKTPPEMTGDIYSDGITLIGGGSILYGFPEFLANYIGVKVTTVDNPKTCVAKGTAMALKNFDLLKNGDYRFKSLDELSMA
ncbi:MAG: rod shape-determining protein [Clostridia bacterium]|nr:rod shape-determining protein [Clostridia bacterium]